MAGSIIQLNTMQARKLVLSSQAIYQQSKFGEGVSGLVNVIEHLSYIQIDTIAVIERAHHHTLWNRLKNYSANYLDEALEQGSIFEYWAHAAAYLPMSNYRFSLPRKSAIAGGQRHWYDKDPNQAKYVLDRIRDEGPLRAHLSNYLWREN